VDVREVRTAAPDGLDRLEQLAEGAVQRFAVVIYLCGAPNVDLSEARRECRDYAGTLTWGVVAEIEDRDAGTPPEERAALREALRRIESREAGALLTMWPSMISTAEREYHEVARQVEAAGGFLHVVERTRT
jgi:hypothetical protein